LPVWEWHNNLSPPQYASSVVLKALTGYWIFAESSDETLLLGYVLNTPRIRFFSGWNLIGVPPGTTTISDAAIHPTYWRWDGDHFQSTTTLFPGVGYWVHSSQSFIYNF
jgi:hypothetical protein